SKGTGSTVRHPYRQAARLPVEMPDPAVPLIVPVSPSHVGDPSIAVPGRFPDGGVPGASCIAPGGVARGGGECSWRVGGRGVACCIGVPVSGFLGPSRISRRGIPGPGRISRPGIPGCPVLSVKAADSKRATEDRTNEFTHGGTPERAATRGPLLSPLLKNAW